MKDYACANCEYVTIHVDRICLQGDGETELCAKCCGCNGN
jgi:hypothetical protein